MNFYLSWLADHCVLHFIEHCYIISISCGILYAVYFCFYYYAPNNWQLFADKNYLNVSVVLNQYDEAEHWIENNIVAILSYKTSQHNLVPVSDVIRETNNLVQKVWIINDYIELKAIAKQFFSLQ